jgi:hypothetical protein
MDDVGESLRGCLAAGQVGHQVDGFAGAFGGDQGDTVTHDLGDPDGAGRSTPSSVTVRTWIAGLGWPSPRS